MAQKKKTKSAKAKPAKKAPVKKAVKATDIKYVYDFGKKTDGDAKQRELLGGKGANLAEMARIGLPVPPGRYAWSRPDRPDWHRRLYRQRPPRFTFAGACAGGAWAGRRRRAPGV